MEYSMHLKPTCMPWISVGTNMNPTIANSHHG
jgi:hypothetical protein